MSSPDNNAPASVETAQPDGPTGTSSRQPHIVRRRFLQWLAATGAVVIVGTGVRAQRQGLFNPRTGRAYAAWDDLNLATDGLAMDKALRSMIAAAILAASPHNIQNWQFHLGDSSIDVLDDTSRSLRLVDARRREAHLGIGAAVANAEVAAAALGYHVQVAFRPSPTDDQRLARLSATINATAATASTPVSDAALADAIPNRHSDRGPYPAAEPDEALLVDLRRTALSGSEGVDLVWVTQPTDMAEVGDLLITAAQALCDDEPMSIDNARWIRYNHQQIESHADGLVIDAQGLSPVIAMAGALLPATSRSAGDTSWVTSTRDVHVATARAYAMVTGDRDDVTTRLHAGRVLERLHLALTAEGWAMQHMNQAIEMAERDAGRGLPDRFDGRLTTVAGATVLGMARMGRPSGRAVRSPRRPVVEVLV